MSRYDYPIEWAIGTRELILNGHRTSDGDIDRTKLDSTYLVESFDFSPLDIREQREGLHLLTGGDFGPANRMFRHIALRGAINARSAADLEDMEAEFLSAFDLDRAQLDAPTSYGEGTLIYHSPTAFSGPRIGSVVREGFYCRPEGYPITFERRGSGASTRRWAVQLVAAYPYRLLFPAESVLFSTAAGWTQELPNWGIRNGGISRVRFLVVTSGAGATDFTISDGTRSLVLDLSGQSAINFYVDMFTKQIYRANDVQIPQVRTSDIDSFMQVPPGGVEVTVSNTTNITSVTATYHQSRS